MAVSPPRKKRIPIIISILWNLEKSNLRRRNNRERKQAHPEKIHKKRKRELFISLENTIGSRKK
jgi:hypothetical protein